MWLECIGVVSVCCKEVYKFPHITNIPTPHVAQRTFEIVQNRDHADMALQLYRQAHRPRVCSRDFHMRGTNSGVIEVSLLPV